MTLHGGRRRLALAATLSLGSSCAQLAVGVGACGGISDNPTVGDAGAATDTGAFDSTLDTANDVRDAHQDVITQGDASVDAGSDDDGAIDCPARWATMLASPIQPPRHYANIDLAGDSGFGITVEEAEAVNCKGTPYPPDDSGVSGINWGGDGGVDFYYYDSNHVVDQIQLNGAYKGTTNFKSRNSVDAFAIAIGSIKKNGQPFTIDWSNPDPAITELTDAIVASFSPSSPATNDCQLDSSCLIIEDVGQGGAIVGFRPVHFYVMFAIGSSAPLFFYTGPHKPDAGF
jgi:hypothetical protein